MGRFEENVDDSRLAACAHGLLWLLWQGIRWPLFALLVILEPVVRLALSAFALLGTLTAFLFRFTRHTANFPFWGMLGVSLSCVGLLAVYYGGIRVLSAR